MIGKLRHVVSQLMMTSMPIRMISVPLLLTGFMMWSVVGCAETAQDASSDPQEAPQPPAMSAVPDVPEAASPPAMPSHEPVYLTSEATESMNLPFSDAVRTGHLLFLSGQIGMVPETKELAPGGIQAEARQTMENIKTVLEANGSSMDRVIKATVMLADISEWPAFNEVYVTYFPGHKPARSAFAGSGLAFGARCEVEVIATVGE